MDQFKNKLNDVVSWLTEAYGGIRSGQAAPALLDGVKVENYGSMMPINQVGSIGVEDARTLRISTWDAGVIPALENVALWHERDISHSSVERMIGPDATVTLDFALNRLEDVIKKLVIYPKKMEENLNSLGGLVHSQQILLALTQKGASREDAYHLVQKYAMGVWEKGGNYLDKMKSDTKIKKYFTIEELENLFDAKQHQRHVDTIFKRVFES